jgi:GAF domain-containing protein
VKRPYVESLLEGVALDAALTEAVADAEHVLDAVDAAGIAVHVGPVPVRAASNPLARQADDVQYGIGQGPCLDAFHTDLVVVLDLDGDDERWRDFQAAAVTFGALTVLSIPLRLDDYPIGSLNLYSRGRRAFSTETVRQAELFARPAALRLARAGVAVLAVEVADVAGLELQDRAVVDRALGYLMGLHQDSSPERARLRLEAAARDAGLDLPQAAARILTERTGTPRPRLGA